MPYLTKLQNELEIEKKKLNTLLEITKSVSKNFKINDLLQEFEFVMKEHVGIQKLAFVNKKENWVCVHSYGVGKSYVNVDFNPISSIQKTILIREFEFDFLEEFDLLLPVLQGKKPISYLLIGGFVQSDVNDFMQKHLGFIQTLANVVSIAIENKIIAKVLIEKKQEEKDMKLAGELQRLLLPSELPTNETIDIAATYIAKHKVSGDYYDFIHINEEEYVFCIADVSGKGMSAALLMANFQANLRANVKYNHNNLTLEELIVDLNQNVISSSKGEKFITFFIGYYNKKTCCLKYINAGHNYPILIHKNKALELKTGCIALGVLGELPKVETEVIKIESNSIIVCYTDGMIEAEDHTGEQYQTDRLLESISANSYLGMEELNKALLGEIEDFMGGDVYPDDTALISLRII